MASIEIICSLTETCDDDDKEFQNKVFTSFSDARALRPIVSPYKS